MRTIGLPYRNLDAQLASTRLRIEIPSRHIEGYRYVFGSGEINVCVKHFTSLKDAAALPGKRIWDVTDDHYDSAKLGSYYRSMPSIVDVVTCTTPILAHRITTETGVVPVVIPDPTEYPRQPARVTQPDNIFWYGHISNLQALFDLRLQRPVLIVTNSNEPCHFPFSAENMQLGFGWCDAVILPVKKDGIPRPDAKSANRMTEAINAGRFVIANYMPAYEGWDMWLGDIEEGLEWLRNNQQEALSRLQMAQNKVTMLLAPRVIARQWKALFDSISDAEQSDGTDISTSISRITGPENRQMSAPI